MLTFAVDFKHRLIMEYKNNFDAYRKWFNKNFSFSLDGKFKGLSTALLLFGEHFIMLLAHKIYKLIRARGRYKHNRIFDCDKTTMRVSGHNVSLYLR